MFFIYKITNIIDQSIYIGKTNNVKKRIKDHERANGSSPLLHNAIKKYGISNFKYETIESSDNEQIIFELEKKWIKFYRDNGFKIYNLTDGGDGSSGIKRSEKHKQAISRAHKDKIVSKKTRKKLSENARWRGQSIPSEIKKKISNSLKGVNNPFYGKHHSADTILLLKNRTISDKTKQKISEGCRGEKQWNSKLTKNDVIDIRLKYESGNFSQKELADLYNVKKHTINQIVHRKRWKHLK